MSDRTVMLFGQGEEGFTPVRIEYRIDYSIMDTLGHDELGILYRLQLQLRGDVFQRNSRVRQLWV